MATGAVSLFPSGVRPAGLTKGPDNNIWFTGYNTSLIGVAKTLRYTTIAGRAYYDQNVSGTITTTDQGLAGRTVYLDLNKDGKLDPDDPTAVTDQFGFYTLNAPALGTYTGRELTYPGDTLTGGAGAGYTDTLAQDVVGPNLNFGLVTAGAILPLTSQPAPFGSHNPNLATAEVIGLYSTVLGRTPDAAGVANWMSFLNNGGTVALMTTYFLTSPEYESGVVASYYKGFLGRTATAPEINSWVNAINNGLTEKQDAFDFISSAEFGTLHASNSDFITALYNDILGRQPASSEITFWSNELGSGLSRPDVIQATLGSTEGLSRSVNGFYSIFLARPSDAPGLAAWVNTIQSGTSLKAVASLFAASPEYASRANATVG
jgi:hypothetical protein